MKKEAAGSKETEGGGSASERIDARIKALDTVKMNKALNGEGVEEKPEMAQADGVAVAASTPARAMASSRADSLTQGVYVGPK
ncbi:hypothetical protein [Pseudomonas sp. P9_31]|uniref:hypothetical protein n=1 Tax=Pseudomonas sp. P9_31 TaxID=3043448 RepID=UPI002A35EE90|nr:hypothetical protein [Pseudomonas sp. P9_31]WPN56101.1 hypothetical protein QMK51_18300 [Pseudomonas sp. P9_31]